MICDRYLSDLYFQNRLRLSRTSLSIGHVQYINILTWLRGFQDKLLNLALFSLYPSLFWELRDKRKFKNLQFWPESLGAMLEYWYIERGLLRRRSTFLDCDDKPWNSSHETNMRWRISQPVHYHNLHKLSWKLLRTTTTKIHYR